MKVLTDLDGYDVDADGADKNLDSLTSVQVIWVRFVCPIKSLFKSQTRNFTCTKCRYHVKIILKSMAKRFLKCEINVGFNLS